VQFLGFIHAIAYSAAHLSIGVFRFNHPFIWPHVHAPAFFGHARGVRTDRPDPLAAVVSYPHGVADLTEGVVELARLGPLLPHHTFSLSPRPSFSFASLYASSSSSSGQLRARGRPILPSHLASTIAMWWPLFLLFSFPPFSTPLLFLVFLLLFSFFHSPHWFSTLILRIVHSAQTPAVAGSQRNYSYLPPTLSDSRLFRGSRPPLRHPISLSFSFRLSLFLFPFLLHSFRPSRPPSPLRYLWLCGQIVLTNVDKNADHTISRVMQMNIYFLSYFMLFP